MTSAEPRRRRDVKSLDREKSMSPLDKDQLKRRCLERVRTERSRLMARMRGRKGTEEEARQLFGHAGGNSGSPLTAAAAQGENLSSPGHHSLSSAREILREGLSELSGGNGDTNKRRRQQHHPTNHERTALGCEEFGASLTRLDSNGGGRRLQQQQQQQQKQQQKQHAGGSESLSFLSAIEEENASYLNACARGQGGSLQQRGPRDGTAAELAPMSISFREQTQGFVEGNNDEDDALMAHDDGHAQQPRQPQQQQQQQQQQPEAMVDEDELGWGDGGGAEDCCDEENLLSPDEYLEMMQYIEEACKEEDLRAEAAGCLHFGPWPRGG
ncbi:unnamed protein product [Ectocarpus sp. CCAP 1310/34]|nr:unnamed protein product [Ectocarpus sp. CCAP 1310/34]